MLILGFRPVALGQKSFFSEDTFFLFPNFDESTDITFFYEVLNTLGHQFNF
jgi:hypothetical protein